MSGKKRLKLKKPILVFLKVLGAVCIVVLLCCSIFFFQVNELKKIGYSSKASKNILFSFKKDYVLSVGENKTLNAAFESSYYRDKYLDNYAKIKYQKQENIIKNINKLLDKGYSNSNISMILEHGDDAEVSEFVKRDKIKYLEEFYSVDYAKLSNYDRYLKYSDETGEDEETTVLYVNLDMDKEDYNDFVVIDKFSIDMLVNKHRKLDSDFVPSDLVQIDEKYASEEGMRANKEAINAFIQMFKAATKENLGLVINSSYRSYSDQEEICESYRELYGDSYVERYVAQPGFSEHQTGLAFDIGSTSSRIFADSKEYEWLQDNAYKYGFILRFSKKYENVTGFRNEPWHYRYVGKKIAKYIYEHNITLEEYYVTFLYK